MPERKPTPTPDLSPQSVATPSMVASCPVCGRLLTGRQTVCSGRCRIQRSMARRKAKQRERDAKVRLLLTEALGLLSEAKDTGSGPDH